MSLPLHTILLLYHLTSPVDIIRHFEGGRSCLGLHSRKKLCDI